MFISKEELQRLKDTQKRHDKELENVDINIHNLLNVKNEYNDRLKVLEKHLENYLTQKAKKESEEPFIEILSQSFDEKLGLELKLDWNDAMINYLKRNGYRGYDDEDIVMKYASDIFNEKAKIKDAPEPIA